VTNPRVVVEVLSPSTANYDLGEKREHYQRLASLSDYVVVHQDRRRVEIWSREGDAWSHRVHEGGARARLASIEVELDVADLYATAGVDVP
jgi:Uma2 family endonuclease